MTTDDRTARLALSCVVEPGDLRLARLLRGFEPVEIWNSLRAQGPAGAWRARARGLDLRAVERAGRACGARFLVPGEPGWPEQVDDLAAAAPVQEWDAETPLEETMQAFADVVRQGKALYIGVSEWTADQIRAGHALAQDLGIQLISSQPQYSMLWRVIESEVVPTSAELGVSQIVWSPVAQGVLTGKYLPGQPAPAGSRATDEKGGATMISRFMNDEVLTQVQNLKPIADDLGITMAQLAVAWVLANPNVAGAIIGASRPEQVADNAKAVEVTLDADVLAAIDAALGGVVQSDAGLTAQNAPATRPV